MSLSFEERLKKAEKSVKRETHSQLLSEERLAWGVTSDLIASLIVGCRLGLFAEHIFKALHPWGLVIGFLLGAASALLKIYRSFLKDAKKKE